MFALVFAEVIYGFKRNWKLYLTNILSILIIIILYAYIGGSRRQLNLQKTVFSGEVVLKMKKGIENINVESLLRKNLKSLLYVSKKIRSDIQYRLPGQNGTGTAEMVGVNWGKDKNLTGYITLFKGHLPQKDRDILIPYSLLNKADIKVGDYIRVFGKTADGVYNSMVFKVSGIYNSSGLTIFTKPVFLIKYNTMVNYYMPHTVNIEYCLFFKNSVIPDTINKDIRSALNDNNRDKVKSIKIKEVTFFDVMDISVQFNVFLILIIILTIIAMASFVILVNFNVHMILFRKKQTQIGTLMAFGVQNWKIGLTFFLESVFQLIICTLIAVTLAYLISFIAYRQPVKGFIEVLVVLLSGTNRLDFYIRFPYITRAFWIIFTSVVLAELPVFIKILFSNPINLLQRK